MKKQFLTGFIAGAVTFGTLGTLAASIIATPNQFPITFNGNSVSMEGYNIEGSTYFKLRDVANVVGRFNVDFKDNTICLNSGSNVGNIGEVIQNPIDLSSLKIAGAKTDDDLVIYLDDEGNQYVKLTEANSNVMYTGPSQFDMWIIGYTGGNWTIDYINVTNDTMWYGNLVYRFMGGQLYTYAGQYYLTASDYINYVLPNLGLINDKPNSHFVLTENSRK